MRRLPLIVLLVSLFFPAAFGAVPAEGFRGVWQGRIIAPHAQTEFGLAFVEMGNDLLVSVHFPEMFLHSANFGFAQIAGSTFTLPPLQLSVTLQDEVLAGTFGPAQLPVELRRGGNFSLEPPPVEIPAAPAPLWTQNLGAALWASPVAHGDIIYLGSVDGKFHALHASDGRELWTWSGPHPLYGTALVTEDAVYFVDARTNLICLDRGDGSLRWQTPLDETRPADASAPADATLNHRTTVPVIDARGTLYVGSTDRHLYAIRARTGKTLWRVDLGAPVHAAVALRGSDVIVPCFDGALVTVETRRGREKSRVPLGGALVSAPVVAGPRIVIGARDSMLSGLDSRGQIAWRNSFWFSWIESAPHFADGTLYVGSSDFRRVSALDARNGAPQWATDVLGLSWGTPVVTADTVFAATAGRQLPTAVIQHQPGIVALDRATGTWKWRYVPSAATDATFTGFAGSLALLSDRVIGAALDGTLIALPISASP